MSYGECVVYSTAYMRFTSMHKYSQGRVHPVRLYSMQRQYRVHPVKFEICADNTQCMGLVDKGPYKSSSSSLWKVCCLGAAPASRVINVSASRSHPFHCICIYGLCSCLTVKTPCFRRATKVRAANVPLILLR